MATLSPALSIAFWLVGSLWTVGLVAYMFDLPSDYVWVAFVVGIGVALFEWNVHAARSRSEHDK
jgi:hypothetical protein